MTDTQQGAAVRIPPPLVYATAIFAAVMLHAFAWPLSLGLDMAARAVGGAALFLPGLLLLGAASSLFRRTGQDPKPWRETPVIVSNGIYRWSRNPMYVGMALLQAGVGVGLSNGWILVLIPLVLVAVYATAVRHEEAYLEQKFGNTYRDYKQSVRRWI